MVSLEPTVSMSGRYSINETVAALGISKRTLYRYFEDGTIKYGIRRANGRRFCLGSEIIRFWKSIN